VARPAPTFRCHICLSNEKRRYALSLASCGHAFCAPCLRTFIDSRVADGQVDLRCPYVPDAGPRPTSPQRCETVLSAAEVDTLVLHPRTRRRFLRFRRLRENPHLQECPRCECLQPGSPEAPGVTCTDCQHRFCFTHGDAHPADEDCEAFERREQAKKQEELSRELVELISRPCPQCQALTYKYTGCNHMTCPRCGDQWCWLCGQSVADVAAHFDVGDENAPCAGRQFEIDVNEEYVPEPEMPDELHWPPGGLHTRRALQARWTVKFRTLFEATFRAISAAFVVAICILMLAFAIVLTVPCMLAGTRMRRFWCFQLNDRLKVLGWAAVDCVCNAASILYILLAILLIYLFGPPVTLALLAYNILSCRMGEPQTRIFLLEWTRAVFCLPC